MLAFSFILAAYLQKGLMTVVRVVSVVSVVSVIQHDRAPRKVRVAANATW